MIRAEEAHDTSIMVNTTAAALKKSPDPAGYLDMLMSYNLLDENDARRAAIEFIVALNRNNGFAEMAYYDNRPFHSMDLPTLQQFIRFVKTNKLDFIKVQKPFSSTF